jgi:hypothetical protein
LLTVRKSGGVPSCYPPYAEDQALEGGIMENSKPGDQEKTIGGRMAGDREIKTGQRPFELRRLKPN